MDDISLERLTAAIAAIETIATNHDLLLKGKYGTSKEDVMTVCQYARKAWYDAYGGRRKS